MLRPGGALVAWCASVDLALAGAGPAGLAALPAYEMFRARLLPFEEGGPLAHARNQYRSIECGPGWQGTWHEVPRTQSFTLQRLVGFLGTISAYAAWLRAHPGDRGSASDPLEQLKSACVAAGLPLDTPLTVPVPFFVVVYRLQE